VPIAPAPEADRMNPVPAGREAPLSPQQQVFKQSQRRARAGCGRGQAFNLTAEKAEASEEVVAGTILVRSVPVISLFDSGASHCYISTSFVMMHSIPCYDMDTQWEIGTKNGIITTSRVCKSYSVEVCRRQLRADMFVIDTGGYDVVLGMTWLSKYHAVIDCRNKSVIF